MNENKKILKSTYRPDFKIPQITKLEGIKTSAPKSQLSEPFASPLFGRQVPDVIVVPEIQGELGDVGKRLDAFRDVPREKKRDDYTDFNLINEQTRIDILGGRKVEPKKVEPNKVEEKTTLVSTFEPPVVKPDIEEQYFDIEIEPIEEFAEPTPELYGQEAGFRSSGVFETMFNDEAKEEVLEPKQQTEKQPIQKRQTKYTLPNPKMFEVREKDTNQTPDWLLDHIDIINETLESFNIDAHVIGHVKGPTVTRYEVSIGPGVRSNRLTGIADNLQMNLEATSIRIETPVPGKPFAGLEVPNVNPEVVPFGNIVNDKEFINDKSTPLKVALGVDIDGSNVYVDISKMPHGLIAGATNSGKSVCVNTLLASLLIKNTPEELNLILIDPKIVELSAYNDLPHLIAPVITEPKMASEALKWVVTEMDNRYRKFASNRSRDINSYNEQIKLGRIEEDLMPYIVVVIDELADLMNVAASDVEQSIQRITQKARAAGIHLIVATQRPSTDVVKGTIKSNIPSRIAFRVASHVDSSTILDSIGAEKLLGKGDMLLKGADRLIRLQGAYIPDHEIYELTDFIRSQSEPKYRLSIDNLRDRANNRHYEAEERELDELFVPVAFYVVENNVTSINRISTDFRLGFNRAKDLVEALVSKNIISRGEGTKSGEVIVTIEELEEIIKGLP